jgi:hypothetical protein
MATKNKKYCKHCGHLPGSSKFAESFLNRNGYCGWCIQEGIKSDEDAKARESRRNAEYWQEQIDNERAYQEYQRKMYGDSYI